MPSNLDGLPNEIISSIFTQLYGEQGTLAALCRVSRYFCSIARPCLYRIIEQHEDAPHDIKRNPLLLRSLLRNPELGNHVVEVQLRVPDYKHEDVSCFSEEEWVLIKDLVARLYETGLFTEELFSKNILHTTSRRGGASGTEESCNLNVREGQWDCILSLLLYCCPRLEKLRGVQWDAYGSIYPGFYFFSFFMRGVALSKAPGHLHAQPGSAPILPNYRHAHLAHKTENLGQTIQVQSLIPFLCSSAIELVGVDPKIDGSDTERHRLWGTLQFFFKKLVVKQSLMSAATLGYLLDSCEVLEEFVLEYGIEDKKYSMFGNMRMMVYDKGPLPKNKGPLPRGLLKSKKTLTRLELARGFYTLYFQNYSHIDQRLGLLKDFEVLTHLTVKLEFLIWHGNPTDSNPTLCDILPSSLEFLSIATEDVMASADLRLFTDTVSRKETALLRNMEHFEELVLRKGSVVPKLRHLDLDGMQRETAESISLATLKRACATYNVQLSIVLYHGYYLAPGEPAMSSKRVSF
ncbi:hypothetical protein VE03_09975 [Pseudogymnoascus sp. 23342-1-I1]|nr:hypothetical protein VE03_09975 [Pseudogymnoascus sp. 23342-1-I1]